jgi:sigma-B regulation protein RsbU (phosphoserine phosphatase)
VIEAPVVHQYQRALDEFRRAGEASPLLKRMSELISLLDLTTTLNSALSREEILDAALLIVLGEMQAVRGVLLVGTAAGVYERRAGRGLPASAPRQVELAAVPTEAVVGRGDPGWSPTFDALGMEVVCPVVRHDRAPGASSAEGGMRVIALLGLGPRMDGRGYGAEERAFLHRVAACAATPIENGLIHHELRELNQRLSVKVFQLHNLFDISRELVSTLDEDAIKNLVTSTVMGQLLVSRCALFLRVPGGLALAHERGVRSTEVDPAVFPAAESDPVLDALTRPFAVTELPEGALKRRLQKARLGLVVPLSVSGRAEGLLAVGDRVSGVPFTEEDRDFAQTLGRQAMAALENVRLHRVSLEKQRRDREMQIAREIQQSLFPQGWPDIPHFDVAAESHSCYEVGGDHYDVIPVGPNRWALAIADVAGKGAPASILMASVHASLRALAGMEPSEMADRLNRFLYESTQPNKYVTLFFGELDTAARRLAYVNAGHVPPFWIRKSGPPARLDVGGPVLGLLEGARFETGQIRLDPGDVLAIATDGATEALASSDTEFGDARLEETVRRHAAGSASAIVRGVVEAVQDWTGALGCTDDLTLLVLKAREA